MWPLISIDRSFEDPSRATGSDDQRLATFRRVRDQIEARIAEWIKPQSIRRPRG